MKKYQLDNIKDLITSKNLSILNNCFIYIENYIKANVINYLNFNLPRTYEIIADNNYFISIDSKAYYKTLCKLLNIDYIKVDESSIKEYYMVQYQNKLATLKSIKSEEELTHLFPELNTFYQKKKHDIEICTNLYYTIARLLPKEAAEYIKKKTLIKNNITEINYIDLLNESRVFSFPYFINRIINDINNLLNYEPIINSMIYDSILNIQTLKNIDKNILIHL